jgi:hypothetical protein
MTQFEGWLLDLVEAFSPSGGPGGITSLVEITNGRVRPPSPSSFHLAMMIPAHAGPDAP